MRALITFILVLANINVFAQDTIIIKKHLFPVQGFNLPVNFKQVAIDSPGLDVIYSPSSQSWNLDLSQYTPDATGKDEFKRPADISGGDQISGADYGFEYRFGNAFFKNKGDQMQLVGFAPNIDLPFTLAFQFDSTVAFLQAPLMAGDTLEDSTTSLLQIPFFFNIQAKMTNRYVALDNGKITLPGDTIVDVLRSRRELVFYAIAEDLINSTIDTLADTLITFEFYAQKFKSTVARAEFQLVPIDTVNFDTALFITYYSGRPVSTNLPNELDQIEIKQFGNQIIISSDVHTRVRIVNISGTEIVPFGSSLQMHQIEINALSKGAFIVQVQSANGYTSQVLMKE
ncbi:MAG: T9SS type A sorting domain-containing protein [Bacteroidia bacterium]